MEQRTFLFTKLRNLKLNTYVYAPKDDLKHRSQWRLLYDPEEQSEFVIDTFCISDSCKQYFDFFKANLLVFLATLVTSLFISF